MVAGLRRPRHRGTGPVVHRRLADSPQDLLLADPGRATCSTTGCTSVARSPCTMRGVIGDENFFALLRTDRAVPAFDGRHRRFHRTGGALRADLAAAAVERLAVFGPRFRCCDRRRYPDRPGDPAASPGSARQPPSAPCAATRCCTWPPGTRSGGLRCSACSGGFRPGHGRRVRPAAADHPGDPAGCPPRIGDARRTDHPPVWLAAAVGWPGVVVVATAVLWAPHVFVESCRLSVLLLAAGLACFCPARDLAGMLAGADRWSQYGAALMVTDAAIRW